MKFDDHILQAFVNNFYGYGTYNAKYWFIGMEEGGGNSFAGVDSRLALWNERGRKELEDVAEYHIELGMPQFFSGKPKLQTTWNKLIRIVLSSEGHPVTTDEVRDYQKRSLGRANGDTCLIELLPLPSPSTGHWLYSRYSGLAYLIDRHTYRDHLAEGRADHIRMRIKEYSPAVVVSYSLNREYQQWWRYITGVQFHQVNGLKFYWGMNDHTLFVITIHPAAKGITNQYFHNVGRFIAEHLRRIEPHASI